MSATLMDKKRRMTLPEAICEAAGLRPNDRIEWRVEQGEIRGRKLVARKKKEAFPRGSLVRHLTAERDREQLAILSACVKGPSEAE
jgi:bifunctional DNA-binding transcriptional regulator/antitoxin component of YhaV-PrlF toxin-antitoxin module